MIKKTTNHIRQTYWSMKNAYRGIGFAFKTERNLRTEIAISIVTFGYGYYLGFSYIEFAIIFLAAFTVLGAELLNTAIEESWNRLHPDHHAEVGRIKDIASGGVFLVGVGAGLAGLLIFLAHII